jgi:hypothetical protein
MSTKVYAISSVFPRRGFLEDDIQAYWPYGQGVLD